VRGILFLAALLITTTARAGCDLNGFDGTAPSAVRGPVDNEYGKFEWGSDVDVNDAQAWIWNFIVNNGSDKSLSATWKKAGIRIGIANPLPPNEAYCNQYPVSAYGKDTDAPIVYGTQTQQAAVYMRINEKRASNTISSTVQTAYEDEQKKLNVISVTINFYISDNILKNVEVISPQDIYVGLSGLSEILRPQIASDFLNAAEGQGGAVALTSYRDFANDSEIEQTFETIPLLDKYSIIFVKGPLKDISLELPVSAEMTSSPIVILDKEKRLIGTAFFSVPLYAG